MGPRRVPQQGKSVAVNLRKLLPWRYPKPKIDFTKIV